MYVNIISGLNLSKTQDDNIMSIEKSQTRSGLSRQRETWQTKGYRTNVELDIMEHCAHESALTVFTIYVNKLL
jgi:hypothetical protein